MKNSVDVMYDYEKLKILPNEFGTDEVANRPHQYLRENDLILETAIENQTLADHADVQMGETSDAHAFLSVSGDQYTPNVLTRTGASSAEWKVGTFSSSYIDNCHPALTSDGKCRIGDGFWYYQADATTTVRNVIAKADYDPIAGVSGAYTYFYGNDTLGDILSTLQEDYAYANVPIARGYSLNGITFNAVEDLRPIYTPAQQSASVSPSGAVIAQYQPWSKTFVIVNTNDGPSNVFRHNEPYLPGRGLLNVYLNGVKMSMRGPDNVAGAYAELDPYSILFYDTLVVGDVLELHSDLGFIRNVGIVADFLPGCQYVTMASDTSNHTQSLNFNFPAGMHMLEVFRNGLRLTSSLDYQEGVDNMSVSFKIPLKVNDVMVYYCPMTYVSNVMLSGDTYTNVQVMHGASEAYRNLAVSQAFDGMNTPSISGALSGMHFYDILVTGMPASASSIPKITEFELYINIASTSGAYETVGRMAGQITWKTMPTDLNYVDFNASWGGYKISTNSAITAIAQYPIEDNYILNTIIGDARYTLIIDSVTRKITHMGLTDLMGASGLDSTETLQSTLGLKNFSNRISDTASSSIMTWRSFNTSAPDTLKSLASSGSEWSIFSNGYPATSGDMTASSAVFDVNTLETMIKVRGENFDQLSTVNRSPHLDADIELNWSKDLAYVNGTLSSQYGRIYSISSTMPISSLTSGYALYFDSDDADASITRPCFIFNIYSPTRLCRIDFRTGTHGFEANNDTTRWTFTTTAINSISDSTPVLSDRLIYPGSNYQTTVMNIAGRVTNSPRPASFGTLSNTRALEAYRSDGAVVYNAGNPLFPISIPSTAKRSILRLNTKHQGFYDARYNIIINWVDITCKITYECLIIRANGFNIIGREDGLVNNTLTFCQNSNLYRYDTIGTVYPTGNMGVSENPTTIADAVSRVGKLLVTDSGTAKSIVNLPIMELDSLAPSYFDLTIENYEELNP